VFVSVCGTVFYEREKEGVSYKTMPQTDTNTETGGCMYCEGLLMMSA
jgi:hypothetical protein